MRDIREQEVDRDQYLERARALVPTARGRADACEKLRRLPDETRDDFQSGGLWRALQPRAWGGYELDPWTFFEAVMAVGAACPSSGWVLGVLGVHSWQLALFPEQAQRDVWGQDPSAMISSSYAPTGTVEVVDGGFKLTGRWSFSSGCDHCAWVFVGGVAPGEGPVPDFRTFLVPRADYAINDDWHVTGLCGTGSKEIVIDGAFVPEHRTHKIREAFELRSPGQSFNEGPLYRLPFGCVFASVLAAAAIGAGEGALESFRSQTRGRVSTTDRSKAVEDPFIHVRLTDAAADLDAARSSLERDWRELNALAAAGGGIPFAPRVRCRSDAVRAVSRSLAAVDRLFEASGGRAIFLANPMQRYFRDVHAMRAHAMNNPEKTARIAGRFYLSPDENADPGDIML